MRQKNIIMESLKITYLGSNLVSALSSLNVNDFPHFEMLISYTTKYFIYQTGYQEATNNANKNAELTGRASLYVKTGNARRRPVIGR